MTTLADLVEFSRRMDSGGDEASKLIGAPAS